MAHLLQFTLCFCSYCRNNNPDISTHGNYLKVSFLSDRRTQSPGAECWLECVAHPTTGLVMALKLVCFLFLSSFCLFPVFFRIVNIFCHSMDYQMMGRTEKIFIISSAKNTKRTFAFKFNVRACSTILH